MNASALSPDLWQDPALPELSLALQPAALARAIADATTDAAAHALALRVRHGHIVSVRYKPGQRCLLAIALPESCLADRVHEHVPSTLCLLNLFGAEFPARAQRGYAGAIALPALRAFLWQFPHDRKLTTLAHFATPERVGQVLARLPLAPPLRGHALHVQPVHYLPEHGYTVRVSLAESSCAPLYGKCSGDGRGQRALGHMQALRARPRAFAIAAPLGTDAPSCSSWQLGLERLRAAGIAEVVPALRALHRTVIPMPRMDAPRDGTDAAAELARAQHIIGTAFPHLGASVQHTAAALCARLARTAPAPGLVHGDLHPGNYFIGRDPTDPARGARPAFIDLDDLRMGDVLRELGSLAAHGINLALLEGRCAFRTFEQISAELEDYRTPQGHTVTPDVLRAHAALALLCERATRGITRMKLTSAAHLDALLETADALIAA